MGATISPSLQNNLDRYIRRVTGKKSWRLFLWQGFVLTLLSGLPGILATFLRGKLYRRVLGGLGHGCLFEKDVRLYVPRRVFLGNRVMIGEGTLLDACCDEGNIELGDDAWVSRGCILVSGSGKIQLGRSAYLGYRALLLGHAGIRIGENTLIANDVQLICGSHIFSDPSVPIRQQGADERPIVVGDDVWIAASAIVLGGVTVGDGAVVGAGAVVTKDIPPYSIALGVPAQVVGQRA